jgi:hypothetical protein
MSVLAKKKKKRRGINLPLDRYVTTWSSEIVVYIYLVFLVLCTTHLYILFIKFNNNTL